MIIRSLTISCIAAYALAKNGNGKGKGNGIGGGASQLELLGQDPGFLAFAAKYNKHYKDTEDFSDRQLTFHKNQNMIKDNNSKKNKHDPLALILEENAFTDFTEAQWREYLNMPQNHQDQAVSLGMGQKNNNGNGNGNGNGKGNGRGNGRGLAAEEYRSVNWAQAGKMFKVKDQAGCGSCWAFAANSVAEGTLAIKSNSEPVHLSEQHLIDCTLSRSMGGDTPFDRDYGAWGCKGAWYEYAWNMQTDHGAMLDADYPYTSGSNNKEGACKHDSSKIVGKVKEWSQLKRDVEEIKETVLQQPVAVALDAGKAAFQFYKRGVIRLEDECGTAMTHAVVVVGFDETEGTVEVDTCPTHRDAEGNCVVEEEEGGCQVTKWWHTCPEEAQSRRLTDTVQAVPHWVVQNSWGRTYGDDGFVKIEIVEGVGICGINQVVQKVDWVDSMYN